MIEELAADQYQGTTLTSTSNLPASTVVETQIQPGEKTLSPRG